MVRCAAFVLSLKGEEEGGAEEEEEGEEEDGGTEENHTTSTLTVGNKAMGRGKNLDSQRHRQHTQAHTQA